MNLDEPLGIRDIGFFDLYDEFFDTDLLPTIKYIETALVHFQCMFLYKEFPVLQWRACWLNMFDLKEATNEFLDHKVFFMWPANVIMTNIYRGESMIVGANEYKGIIAQGAKVHLVFSQVDYPEAAQIGPAILMPELANCIKNDLMIACLRWYCHLSLQ